MGARKAGAVSDRSDSHRYGATNLGGIAGDAAWIGKILLFVFLILAVVSLVLGPEGFDIGMRRKNDKARRASACRAFLVC